MFQTTHQFRVTLFENNILNVKKKKKKKKNPKIKEYYVYS